MATPAICAEEIELAKDPSDLPKPGSLGTISLNLNAQTIQPYLKIDKTIQLDGQRHIKFKVWAQQAPEAPYHTRNLTFSNDTKADMVFNLTTSGPFEIVGTKSNTGSKHPLAAQQTNAVKKKVETMFCLQPLKIVEVQVRFRTPKPSQTDEWPMIMTSERHGELVAAFNNGEKQTFALEGQLLRPKLNLLTEVPSKNDFAMDEMDFGICNVDCFKTITLYLSNITEVSSKWQLSYVKFPKKITMSKYTQTAWEEENLKKVDDPDVFEFSVSSVSQPTALCSTPCRVYSRAKRYRCALCQLASACPLYPWMTTRSSSCPRRSWSTSGPSRTSSTRASSASSWTTASPAT